MDCQTTIKNLKINKNKSIGEVIIVVEGEDEEFRLLKHIFTEILDYSYVEFNRRNKTITKKFQSKTNPSSTVIIANTNSSLLSSITDDSEYKEKLFKLLREDYHKSLNNIPIYILWDRDRETNSQEVVEKALKTYGNARDNGFEMNGLLLLNYPCVESYELSNFIKQEYNNVYSTSKECKKNFKESIFNIKKIKDATLFLAIENMNRSIKKFNILEYNPDFFKDTNLKIFNKQEELFKNKEIIQSLSLISIMLLDLGIIEEKSINK